MLRSTLLATACLALALPASAENQTYDMNSFNELDVSAGVTVIYEAGDTQSIIAENDSGNFEKLVIENRGDALVISRKRSGLFGNRNRQNYTVRITGPAISAVEASSGSSVHATGLVGDIVQLEASSGAALKVSDVQAKDISLKASSGSTLYAEGTCTTADLSASSGASVDADELVCAAIEAQASSGASLNAHATSKADGRASSGASIKVVGGATDINKEKSSGGSVTVS